MTRTRAPDGDLTTYDLESFAHDGVEHPIYRKGRGPAVIVMTEIPGIHPKSRSDRRMVRNTVESMRRVGELVWQGTRPMSPGKRGRPATLYVVASDWRCFSANAGADLAAMFAGWAKAAR